MKKDFAMIVVTGAAGFIGSNIVHALNAAQREDIVIVDNAETRQSANLKGLKFQQFLEKEALLGWLLQNKRDVTDVIHMGACSDTTVTDRAFVMRNNDEYTRELWTFCQQHQKKLIYASSAATYGDGCKGYDDGMDISQLQPLNYYGESKQSFDLWALAQKQTPAGWAGLKFFNVYGPRESLKGRMASVVYHAYHQINKTGKVKLFKSGRPGISDGGQQRDFIYVKDVVAVVLHFLKSPAERMNALFNVGTGKARTFFALANATFAAMEVRAEIEFIEMPGDLAGKYQYFTEAKVDKLRASDFNATFYSLEDGVEDYVCHHLMRSPSV